MIKDNSDLIPDSFKEGFRGIMLLKRKKDCFYENEHNKTLIEISKNKNDWEDIILKFLSLQKNSFKSHRIYCSVNSRNIDKAIHEFKIRSLNNEYAPREQLENFYLDIKNNFFSCMMKPNCAKEKNFLIDCDSHDDYIKDRQTIPEELIIFDYPTINGRHIICKPFNPMVFKIISDIKKDDMMLIN